MSNYQEQIDALTERVTALEARQGTPGPNSPMPRPREPEPGDEQLFEALKAWRYDRARIEGIPPFRIFGNAVLTAITTAKPADRYELTQIHGIGEEKLAKYGEDILPIVREHLDGEW